MGDIGQMIGWILVGCVMAGLSAAGALKFMLSGYMAQKGKNLATREDFENLLEQVRRTTHETESIRADLSGRHWIRQQYWGKREQYYMELLEELTKLRLALVDQNSFFIEPGSEHDESIPNNSHFKALAERASSSYQRIQELVGPAALFLSDKSMKILQGLIGDYWEAAESSVCTAQFVEQAATNVDYAYCEVLIEAKHALIPESEKSNNSLQARRP